MLNGSLWKKCPVKLFICSKIRPVPFTSGASMSQRTALHVYHASYTFPSFTTMTCYSLFHVLWSTWTRFIWYRSSSAQTSLNNYRILPKPRYYVNSDILVKLYYALIYPFLTHGLISSGNTYSSIPSLCSFYKREQCVWWLSLNFMNILVQFSNTYILFNCLTLSAVLILQS